MSPRVNIAIHVVVAAIFFFYMQWYLLGETLNVSLVWAVSAAVAAGALAVMQSRRGH